MGITFAALLLLLPTAPATRASNIATWQTRLARDSQRILDAAGHVAGARDELAAVTAEHARLHVQVEARVVAIYKSGGTASPLAQAAAANSVADADQKLDALDAVARHDSRELDRWNDLAARMHDLQAEIVVAKRELSQARQDVRDDRHGLAEARAEAEAARARAAELARTPDPVLANHAVGPEAVALATALDVDEEAAATGDDGGGESIGASGSANGPSPRGFVQTGEASMYSDSFAGEETASGERYDPNAYTAAHPSLPLGTWVNVTGPGGAVSVRINDRGPYAGGRIIDLSRAAANAIGLPGIGQVTLSVQG